jgi:hypothetical protein
MAGRIAGVLVGLFVGMMASSAAAQSLADVARQEASRRERLKATGKVTDGRVLTNADLPASAVVAPAGASTPAETASDGEGKAAAPAAEGGSASPAAAAAATLAPKAEGSGKAESAPTDDEAGWRARAERVNGALAAAQTQVRQLKALSDRLSLEAQANDPAIAARAQAERADIKTQVLAAEEKAAAALAARQALVQEARVAGVLPAWIQ